jgi:hypothetical protein
VVCEVKAYDGPSLQTYLDTDLTWRRKEISSLIGLAQISSPVERVALIRASIPLLYAHWEGFVRNCFLAYFELVAMRKMAFDQLSQNFLYLASKSDFPKLASGNDFTSFEAFLDHMKRPQSKNKDPFRRHVNTKSNLRSDVLQALFLIAGMDYKFSEDSIFIDKEICDSRNEIAHGAGGSPELEVLIKRRDAAFALMIAVQAEIVNSVLQKLYLAQKS